MDFRNQELGKYRGHQLAVSRRGTHAEEPKNGLFAEALHGEMRKCSTGTRVLPKITFLILFAE